MSDHLWKLFNASNLIIFVLKLYMLKLTDVPVKNASHFHLFQLNMTFQIF